MLQLAQKAPALDIFFALLNCPYDDSHGLVEDSMKPSLCKRAELKIFNCAYLLCELGSLAVRDWCQSPPCKFALNIGIISQV